MCIRTGYGKMTVKKNLCKTAHAYSSDSDKMYMYWSIKINCKHRNFLS